MIYRGFTIQENAKGTFDIYKPTGKLACRELATEDYAMNWVDNEKRIEAGVKGND